MAKITTPSRPDTLPSILADPKTISPELEARQNVIEMALKMAGAELNPHSNNEFESLANTVKRSAQLIKDDLHHTDEFIRAQAARQPTTAAAKDLFDPVALSSGCLRA